VVNLTNFSERKVVMNILKHLDRRGELPLGDDIADFNLKNLRIGLKIDGFSAYNSKLPWSKWSDLGWKAVTATVSDCIVKGSRPIALVASIGSPTKEGQQIIEDMVEGIVEACRYYNVPYLGGDTNASKEDVWIDVAVISVFETKPLPRNGARPGNIVLATGEYGLTGSAFHAYYANLTHIMENYPRMLEYSARPRASLNLLEVLKSNRDCFTASMDVSDGLAFTLGEVAKASKVDIYVDKVLLPREVYSYSEKAGINPFSLAFYGGEEYGAVLAVKEKCLNHVISELERRGIKVSVYGKVRKGEGQVWFKGKTLTCIGWDHFSKNNIIRKII